MLEEEGIARELSVHRPIQSQGRAELNGHTAMSCCVIYIRNEIFSDAYHDHADGFQCRKAIIFSRRNLPVIHSMA